MGKKFVVGITLLALGLGALASNAVAATPEGDLLSGEFPVAATATSGDSVMSTDDGSTVTCTSGSGSGTAVSSTTGEGTYLLHGCASSGTMCTTPGQSSGTIVINVATAHMVYLDENHTKPGVLATPPASGVFSLFKCGFGLITIEVKGNGLLGEITSPKCGETSKTATVVTEISAHGVQKYQQVEETGTKYDTIAYRNGTPRTVGTIWSVTGTSERASTLTCPEQK